MKRALFDILSVGDAIEQVYSMAASGKDLRRAVSVMTGMVNEVAEIEQLDELDAAASKLWLALVSQEPQPDRYGFDKMGESSNTSSGELHSYWRASITLRLEMTVDGVRSVLTSAVQPILEGSSSSSSRFRVCFMASSGFWLRADDDWAFPLISATLSPCHPDSEAAWVGALYSGAVVIDVRLRSILYGNYRRLLADDDFFVSSTGSNDILIQRLLDALWWEGNEEKLTVVQVLARDCDASVSKRISHMIFGTLTRTNKEKRWPFWLSTYLRLRCTHATGDEAFHLLGALMYNPNPQESLDLMELLDLGEKDDFNSRDTVTLYSVLKARVEGVSDGTTDTAVSDAVLTRLKDIVPPHLWEVVSTA